MIRTLKLKLQYRYTYKAIFDFFTTTDRDVFGFIQMHKVHRIKFCCNVKEYFTVFGCE